MNFDCCKYCKHGNLSVTYDLITGFALGFTLTCNITHKVKSADDTCKRVKRRQIISAV